MAPLIVVAVQLVVLTVTFVAQIRHHPSPTFKALWLAAICGVAGGLDVWYFGWHAYPAGFGV